MESVEKEILEAQFKRIITKLFKDFLVILQDLQQEHLSVISDLQRQFPSELVKRFNYFDMPKYSRIRKKVLDTSNDAIREGSELLKPFNVTLNKE